MSLLQLLSSSSAWNEEIWSWYCGFGLMWVCNQHTEMMQRFVPAVQLLVNVSDEHKASTHKQTQSVFLNTMSRITVFSYVHLFDRDTKYEYFWSSSVVTEQNRKLLVLSYSEVGSSKTKETLLICCIADDFHQCYEYWEWLTVGSLFHHRVDLCFVDAVSLSTVCESDCRPVDPFTWWVTDAEIQ